MGVRDVAWLDPGAPAALLQVPDLVGQTVQSAEALLKQARLTLGQVHYVPASGLKAGVVRSQSPPPLSRWPLGTKVDISLTRVPEPATSAAPQLVRVPDLIGFTSDQARARLSESALRLGRVGSVGVVALRARIDSQRPEPRAHVKRDSPVDVRVRGPASGAVASIALLVAGILGAAAVTVVRWWRWRIRVTPESGLSAIRCQVAPAGSADLSVRIESHWDPGTQHLRETS